MFFETRLNHVGMVNGGIVQHDRNFFAGVEGDDRSQKGQTLHRRTLLLMLTKYFADFIVYDAQQFIVQMFALGRLWALSKPCAQWLDPRESSTRLQIECGQSGLQALFFDLKVGSKHGLIFEIRLG